MTRVSTKIKIVFCKDFVKSLNLSDQYKAVELEERRGVVMPKIDKFAGLMFLNMLGLR